MQGVVMNNSNISAWDIALEPLCFMYFRSFSTSYFTGRTSKVQKAMKLELTITSSLTHNQL